jgi:putative SOS response-associated peptidase YedK
MIITEPNDFVAEVHDRMPALLSEKQFAPWLSGEAGFGNPEARAERLFATLASV